MPTGNIMGTGGRISTIIDGKEVVLGNVATFSFNTCPTLKKTNRRIRKKQLKKLGYWEQYKSSKEMIEVLKNRTCTISGRMW